MRKFWKEYLTEVRNLAPGYVRDADLENWLLPDGFERPEGEEEEELFNALQYRRSLAHEEE